MKRGLQKNATVTNALLPEVRGPQLLPIIHSIRALICPTNTHAAGTVSCLTSPGGAVESWTVEGKAAPDFIQRTSAQCLAVKSLPLDSPALLPGCGG
jgi:hypothetical protein